MIPGEGRYQMPSEVPAQGDFVMNQGASPPPPPGSFLSDEEFESLIKAVQLLRISQLRYVVQKFSIPASGNKTKLLSLVLSIFQSIRYDKALIPIYQEINGLLSQQCLPFANPLAEVSQLSLAPFDPADTTSQNLASSFPPEWIVLGPIQAHPGTSSGSFSFITPNQFFPIIVDFLRQPGTDEPFGFDFTLNGFPFSVSLDDPLPSPIDVTYVLNPPLGTNLLEVKKLACSQQMMICLRKYEFIGAQEIINKACGRHINLGTEQIFGKGASCTHPEPFALVPFVVDAMATGDWSCPICRMPIQPEQLVQSRQNNAPTAQAISSQNSDMFHIDNIDWDSF